MHFVWLSNSDRFDLIDWFDWFDCLIELDRKEWILFDKIWINNNKNNKNQGKNKHYPHPHNDDVNTRQKSKQERWEWNESFEITLYLFESIAIYRWS